MILNNQGQPANPVVSSPAQPAVSTLTNVQRVKNIIETEGNGYTKTDLLEDVLKPLEELKVGADSHYSSVLDNLIKEVSSKSSSKLNSWMVLWKNTFINNPTVNLSDIISGVVRDKLNENADPSKAIITDWVEEKGQLAEELVNELDSKISVKLNSVSSFDLGLNKVASDLDLEVSSILKNLNLDINTPNIDKFLLLQADAWKGVDKVFKSFTPLMADRPYRDIDDISKFSDGVLKEFDSGYHNSDIATTLIKAASVKAQNEFDSIVARISVNKIDSRTLNVLNDVMGSKTYLVGDSLTSNILTTLIGSGNKDLIMSWNTKWDKLFDVKLSLDNKSNPGITKIKLNMELKKDSIVFPKISALDTDVLVDQQMIDHVGVMKVFDLTCNDVFDIKYIVDEALKAYKIWFSSIDPSAIIKQDDFLGFFKGKPEEKNCFKDGFTKSGLTLSDLHEINPVLSDKLKSAMGDISSDIDNDFGSIPGKFFSAYKTQLNLLFSISLEVKDGVRKLSISPTLRDGGLDALPRDVLLPYFDKKTVDDLYAKIDEQHREAAFPEVERIVERISSPLDEESTKVWKAFAKEQPKEIFKKEFPVDLKVDQEVPLSYVEEEFPEFKAISSIFDDKTSRFKINFKIKTISDDGLTLSYSITDVVTNTVNGFDNPDDKDELDNVELTFSASENRAADLLRQLKDSPKGHIKLFDDRDGIRGISRRIVPGLTQSELNAYFTKFESIKEAGSKETPIPVTLYIPNDGENGVVYNLDSDGDVLSLSQKFKASYKVGSKRVEEEIEIPFTKIYLTDEKIKEFQDYLDSEYNTASSKIKSSSLPVNDRDWMLKTYIQRKWDLDQKVEKNKEDLTQDKIDAIKKNNEILNKEIDEFIKKYEDIQKDKKTIEDNFEKLFTSINDSDLTIEYKNELNKEYLDDKENILQDISDRWRDITDNDISKYIELSKSLILDGGDAIKKVDGINYINKNLDKNINGYMGDDGKPVNGVLAIVENSNLDDKAKKQLTAYFKWVESFVRDEMKFLDQDISISQVEGFKQIVDEIVDNSRALIQRELIKQLQGPLSKEFKGDIPPEVQKLFLTHPDLFKKLLKDNPAILHNLDELKKACEAFDKNLPIDQFLEAQKSLQTSGRYTLLALGSLLGFGALLGAANSGKIATTNKKAVNSKTGKIKSSRKLAFISALIGLASAGGSIVTFIYLFIVQGGL